MIPSIWQRPGMGGWKMSWTFYRASSSFQALRPTCLKTRKGPTRHGRSLSAPCHEAQIFEERTQSQGAYWTPLRRMLGYRASLTLHGYVMDTSCLSHGALHPLR